jgi:hypothetical protein
MAYGRDSYRPGRVPKVVRCNAGRDEAAVYKNLGNAHRVKFMWAETVTLASGTYEAVASGTFGMSPQPDAYASAKDSYHPGGAAGKTLDDLHAWATPLAEPDGFIYVDIDTVADTVTINSSEATDDGLEVDVLYFTT